MKDLPYIMHDLGARNDPKLISLQMAMGGQGLAIFWCLVEMLYEQDGYLPTDYVPIAYSLRWATPEEVQKVVEDFRLFKVEGGRFWSVSALERIGFKRSQAEARSEQARRAIQTRWGKRENNPGNTAEILPYNGGNTAVIPNKVSNKEREKERDNNNNNNITTPPTAADLFEIFFLELNFLDPKGETERFIEYYSQRGWCYQDGTPVTDFAKVARDWKPAKQGRKYDTEVLRWYRSIYVAAKNRGEGVPFLRVDSIRRKGQSIALVYRDAEDAKAVASFIMDNDLGGDWKIDFRVSS